MKIRRVYQFRHGGAKKLTEGAEASTNAPAPTVGSRN